jgi:putative ABC transport system substrate-binding protein
VQLFLRILLFLFGVAITSNATGEPTGQPIQVLALVTSEAAPQQAFLQGFQNYFTKKQLDLALSIENAAVPLATKQNPALIVALGSTATRFAIDSFKQIPICACMLIEDSLIRNKSNVSGVSLSFPVTTHLQWLDRFIPHGRAVAVLYNPDKNAAELENMQREAAKLGIPLVPEAVEEASALDNVLKRLPSQVAALWSFDDAAIFTPQSAETLLLYSFRNRIPLIGLSNQWVKAGALYALDRDYIDMGRQCGELALRMLHGSPAQQAVETPRKVVYAINLQTAEHMKLELPKTLIREANEIYP